MQKKKYRKIWDTYKQTVALVFILSILGTMLNAVFNFVMVYQETHQKVALVNDNAAEKIDDYLNDIKALSILPIINFDTFKEFNQPIAQRNDLLMAQNTSSIAFSIMHAKKDVSSVFLFNKEGEYHANILGGSTFGDYNPKDEEWFRSTLDLDGKALVLDYLHLHNVTLQKHATGFAVARKVYNFNAPEEYGVILVNSGFAFFDKLFLLRKMHPDQQLFVVNSETKNIVYSEAHQQITHNFNDYVSEVYDFRLLPIVSVDGKSYIQYTSTCQQANWTVVNLIPLHYIVQLAKRGVLLNLPFFLAIIGLIFGAAILSKKYVFAPLKRLTDYVTLRSYGDNKITLQYDRADEIGDLTKSFNDAFQRLEEMTKREKEMLCKQNEQELKILQDQINPHFLYNTLESIRMLALANGDAEVADITYSLGAVTRYSTTRSNQLVTLGDDIEIIKQYMNIQRTCYGERFDVKFDIEPGMEHLQILKFLIQPIIENAVVHGMKNVSAGGQIQLTAKLCGGMIHIAVSDNGDGIEQTRLARIREALNDENSQEDRIGLVNVNNRIKLFYGQEFGLGIASVKGKWTSVTICVPRVG